VRRRGEDDCRTKLETRKCSKNLSRRGTFQLELSSNVSINWNSNTLSIFYVCRQTSFNEFPKVFIPLPLISASTAAVLSHFDANSRPSTLNDLKC
jgi:hypothetical protein